MNLLMCCSFRHNLFGRNLLVLRVLKENNIFLRILSSTVKSSLTENHVEKPKQIYHTIYRFPAIRFGFLLNKVKWYSTVLCGAVIPAASLFYFGEVIDFDHLTAIAHAGVFITGNMYAYGYIFYQAVGFIYLSEDETTIKISYLGFWGDRVDEEYPISDVMTISDCPVSSMDRFYRPVHLYSTNKKPKLFLRIGGQVTDKERFIKVFGDYTKYD